MVKNLPTLYSKASSSSSSNELEESANTKSAEFSNSVYGADRKVSNASILTTSTMSSNSSDSSYSVKVSKFVLAQNKINEDMEHAHVSCNHRRSCGSIDVTGVLSKASVVGLLDRADQDTRIKNQLMRKRTSFSQLVPQTASEPSSNQSNIKIIMNSEEEETHKASSLNSSQLESKLQANASSLRSENRQYRSNSCSGTSLAISHTIVNNYLSVPKQSVHLFKNRKSSASSILDKSNRSELELLQKVCSTCNFDQECRFYLNDNQSTNSANSNDQSNNASSGNIYFEFLSSESLPYDGQAESPKLDDQLYHFKSHILNSHTSSGINLTKSAADILLENVNFKNYDNPLIYPNISKMVKFKSDTNFLSNLDYENSSKKKTDQVWHNNSKQIPSNKKLNKKSTKLQQKSATSIYMLSGISKPLIKMNSKLKFRSKSSSQLVNQVSSGNNLAELVDKMERNKLESIESKEESESDKNECRRKTSVLHGYYANNYQMYHNLNSHNRNQKRYSNYSNDANSNSNQNSNVKSIAANFAKDIKSRATNLLRRRHTDASFIDKGLVPSREEIYKWQTSFEHLLRHKYGIALFRGFLKTEFSEENIEFWLECEDYKYTNKEIKRIAKSKKIYQDFVAIGSPKEVNLDIELRAHTAQNILNPGHDTFDRAQKRIQALMEKDSYPRFLESSLYKNLLGSYSPPVAEQKSNHVCVSTENLSTSSSSKSIQLSLTKLFNKTNQSETPQDHRLMASTSSNELIK